MHGVFSMSNFNKNHYFVLGIVLGLLFSIYLPQEIREISRECPGNIDGLESPETSEEFEPHLNLAQKPLAAKKIIKNFIRPRYFSSELGIREKLFVGVMTTQEHIDNIATAFNKTTAHLVNKIKFFINADDVKSNFRLKNIVGFTDTRENLKPFHVLKYIADNYLDDFDYFLIVPDQTYVDARKLKEKLYHISISNNIYMGQPVSDDKDTSEVCELNAGIILSSGVIRKIRANLDWCVRNAATNHHSLNIGKCVKYSVGIGSCQTTFQGIDVNSFELEEHKIYRDLHNLKTMDDFNDAIIVYPITIPDDFYLLHIYFSRLHLEKLKEQQLANEKESLTLSNLDISNKVLEVRYPVGVPHSDFEETRHDIISWTYLNLTHLLMVDGDHNVKELSKIEKEDIQKIVNKTVTEVYSVEKGLEFVNLQSAYRKFDPVRGMDYRLFINFRNRSNNQILMKSYEIVKPLGKVEIVPSPYVTESTRISIILPIFEHQITESVDFVYRYEKTCMENQDNTFLLLVFMYPLNVSSKGDDDLFLQLKSLAVSLTEKYKNDGSRIAWVSIRLPEEYSVPMKKEFIALSSIYGTNQILSLAATDLALRKIGLESLVMVAANSMTFRADFLNRVRMNTVQGFLVYSPIGFMTYPCEWSSMCKACETCDVGQGYGYFDRENYDVIAFYSRDYVDSRKRLESVVPIVRNDVDIVRLIGLENGEHREIQRIVDLFVKSATDVHILRAIEPNLRFGSAIANYLDNNDDIPECEFHDTDMAGKCVRFGSKKQFGNAILQFEEDVLKVV